MATRTIITVTSDLSGDEGASTVRFAFDGASYEVDLTDAERDEFLQSLSVYVQAGRKASSRASKPASSSGRRKDLGAIRTWAAKNGHEVSGRGRIAQNVIDAYDAAH